MLSINSRFSSAYAPESYENSSFHLTPHKIARFLLTVITVLMTCSLISTFLLYQVPEFPIKGWSLLTDFLFSKFAVNQEQSIPTLYSSLTLAFCAIPLYVISQFKFQNRERYGQHWRFLSGLFVYLAVDELLSIHEFASKPLHNIGVSGFLHNAWLIPAAFLLLIFGLSFLGFLFHLPKSIRRLFIMAFCIYISGACIVELFGGYYAFLNGKEGLVYVLVASFEELLEMLGIVTFIYALFTYIQQLGIRWLEFRVQVSGAKQP